MSENTSESASLAKWVEQLHVPQTRRLARQRLIAARAVDPLLDCLRSTNQIDEAANFVVVESMAAGVVHASTLARKIEQIAARADQVERLLTQEDRR